jgi:hypothetical protein
MSEAPDEQPDMEPYPDEAPEDPAPDETVNLTVYPDDPPTSGDWVDNDDAISEPTEEELEEGRRQGEEIDVDDDEDAGVDVEDDDG